MTRKRGQGVCQNLDIFCRRAFSRQLGNQTAFENVPPDLIAFLFSGSLSKAPGASEPQIIKPRHWYSLELDVTCQVVKLIEDPEFSSKAVPIYDLVYLASSPAAQVRRIPDIALKLAEPNQMQSQTRIVAEGIAVPNE